MRTFVMTQGAAGEITLGPHAVRVKMEPGVPFGVPDSEAARFKADPNFDEVAAALPTEPETRKGKGAK